MKNTREKNGLIRNAASVFWNFNQGRLRALWRILGALICTAILTFIFGAPFFAASGAGPAPYIEKIVLYIAALVSVYAATRFLDKRKFSDTGIYMQQDWWIDLGFGLFLGALLMTIIFFVELAAGWITITDLFYTPNPNQPFLVAILLPVILLLIVGIVEELLFRGYLLLNLAEGFNLSVIGPRWAIILSWLLTSAIFGFAHAISPNATIISSVYIALIAVWLGLGYVLTGSLAIPIGIHITWNLFQGYVYGFPVSGGRDFSTTFVAIQQGGPDMWTGGVFGPEAGLLGLLAAFIGVLLIIIWVRFRYHKLALFTAIAELPAGLRMNGEIR